MRRALVWCALFGLVVAGCSSATATSAPYPAATDNYNHRPTAAATFAPAATPYSWSTPLVVGTSAAVQFPNVGVNPYIDTTVDGDSTFGLDVDTASYTVARKYVSDGNRPDQASVRVEEWVNYFDQGYAAPESGAFAIHVDGGPTPFLSQSETLLRIGVKAHETSASRRPSAALTLVIDVSGSMGDNDKLEMVKSSLRLLVDELRSDDRVGIVVFTSDARVVLEPTPGSDREAILSAIGKLQPEANTNAEAGLRLGYQMAHEQFLEGGINRVVIATDGVANTGNVDATAILETAGAGATSGIQLVAVGVGMGQYNDALLEQLADKGDGFYAYVDTLDEARRIFVDELTTTLDTVAIDAKAQVHFNSEAVAGYRLIGYEDRGLPDSSFRSPTAEGGAIGAGHSVTALYAVVLRSELQSNALLATVNLRWTDPQTTRASEIAKDLYLGDLNSSFMAADSHFKLDSLVAATAEVLRNSPWIPGYRIADVRSEAAQLTLQLPETADTRDFLNMLDQMSRLD
jgi:Ca-activated chloride channel family protein